VRSLADRSAITVDVTDDLGEQSGHRLPPAVENAAYFVVAEALTNVAKHAPSATARVGMTREDAQLLVDVIDDGQGGADASGAGLRGLKARVEALDGRLAVISPSGGPTVVRAELPCGS
jgi:signal transduction histidine kinase